MLYGFHMTETVDELVASARDAYNQLIQKLEKAEVLSATPDIPQPVTDIVSTEDFIFNLFQMISGSGEYAFGAVSCENLKKNEALTPSLKIIHKPITGLINDLSDKARKPDAPDAVAIDPADVLRRIQASQFATSVIDESDSGGLRPELDVTHRGLSSNNHHSVKVHPKRSDKPWSISLLPYPAVATGKQVIFLRKHKPLSRAGVPRKCNGPREDTPRPKIMQNQDVVKRVSIAPPPGYTKLSHVEPATSRLAQSTETVTHVRASSYESSTSRNISTPNTVYERSNGNTEVRCCHFSSVSLSTEGEGELGIPAVEENDLRLNSSSSSAVVMDRRSNTTTLPLGHLATPGENMTLNHENSNVTPLRMRNLSERNPAEYDIQNTKLFDRKDTLKPLGTELRRFSCRLQSDSSDSLPGIQVQGCCIASRVNTNPCERGAFEKTDQAVPLIVPSSTAQKPSLAHTSGSSLRRKNSTRLLHDTPQPVHRHRRFSSSLSYSDYMDTTKESDKLMEQLARIQRHVKIVSPGGLVRLPLRYSTALSLDTTGDSIYHLEELVGILIKVKCANDIQHSPLIQSFLDQMAATAPSNIDSAIRIKCIQILLNLAAYYPFAVSCQSIHIAVELYQYAHRMTLVPLEARQLLIIAAAPLLALDSLYVYHRILDLLLLLTIGRGATLPMSVQDHLSNTFFKDTPLLFVNHDISELKIKVATLLSALPGSGYRDFAMEILLSTQNWVMNDIFVESICYGSSESSLSYHNYLKEDSISFLQTVPNIVRCQYVDTVTAIIAEIPRIHIGSEYLNQLLNLIVNVVVTQEFGNSLKAQLTRIDADIRSLPVSAITMSQTNLELLSCIISYNTAVGTLGNTLSDAVHYVSMHCEDIKKIKICYSAYWVYRTNNDVNIYYNMFSFISRRLKTPKLRKVELLWIYTLVCGIVNDNPHWGNAAVNKKVDAHVRLVNSLIKSGSTLVNPADDRSFWVVALAYSIKNPEFPSLLLRYLRTSENSDCVISFLLQKLCHEEEPSLTKQEITELLSYCPDSVVGLVRRGCTPKPSS